MNENRSASILLIKTEGHASLSPDIFERLSRWFGDTPDELIYATSTRNEFASHLSCGNYRSIIVPFFSLDRDVPDTRMLRSLAPSSSLVLYCPDLSAIRKPAGDEVSNLQAKRSEEDRKLLLSELRMADVIITEQDDEAALLNGLLKNARIIPQAAMGAGMSLSVRAPKKTSIVILTFNQIDYTRHCLESLRKHTTGGYEVIVVDNGSKDDTRTYLESMKQQMDLKLIFNETNLGFARANNQGIAAATGDYILLLNNDVMLTPHWLERLQICAESDPAIGVVGPVTNHAVNQQVVSPLVPNDPGVIARTASFQAIKNAGCWLDVHRIIGFCMLIKREVVEAVGTLDERFGPGGFEDYDYCLRVKQAGYKIMIASDVFIYHIGGQGYVQNNLDYGVLRKRNVEIFIDKWCRKALQIMDFMP